MILTCPSCGTQYAVKDGAIPPAGRQVRCASCKHAWHQDPGGDGEPQAEPEPGAGEEPQAALEEPVQEAPSEAPPGYAPVDPVAPPAAGLVDDVLPGTPDEQMTSEEQMPVEGQAPEERWTPPADELTREEELPPAEPAPDDDFSPFTMDEHDEERRRSPLLTLLVIALLIAALAATFSFLAPPSWKERIGIADAGETPLQLVMTHSDRQKLASGNELLAVSGRVINPTDEQQTVPPIRAQLHSTSGRLVYSWTIAPPARILAPGASATFNSAEVNVPSGGDELTITVGSAKT